MNRPGLSAIVIGAAVGIAVGLLLAAALYASVGMFP